MPCLRIWWSPPNIWLASKGQRKSTLCKVLQYAEVQVALEAWLFRFHPNQKLHGSTAGVNDMSAMLGKVPGAPADAGTYLRCVRMETVEKDAWLGSMWNAVETNLANKFMFACWIYLLISRGVTRSKTCTLLQLSDNPENRSRCICLWNAPKSAASLDSDSALPRYSETHVRFLMEKGERQANMEGYGMTIDVYGLLKWFVSCFPGPGSGSRDALPSYRRCCGSFTGDTAWALCTLVWVTLEPIKSKGNANCNSLGAVAQKGWLAKSSGAEK